MARAESLAQTMPAATGVETPHRQAATMHTGSLAARASSAVCTPAQRERDDGATFDALDRAATSQTGLQAAAALNRARDELFRKIHGASVRGPMLGNEPSFRSYSLSHWTLLYVNALNCGVGRVSMPSYGRRS